MPVPRHRLTAPAAALCLASCTADPRPRADSAPPPTEAREVIVEIPAADGQLELRAERLLLEPSGGLALVGDASIETTGGLGLRARARRVLVSPDGGALVAEGEVRAGFEVGDGGPPDAQP